MVNVSVHIFRSRQIVRTLFTEKQHVEIQLTIYPLTFTDLGFKFRKLFERTSIV